VEEMPAMVVKRILAQTNKHRRALINELLKYPDDSTGSFMTTEFVDLKANMTVDDAFLRIRRRAVNKETIYTCYVLNETRQLLGIVTVKDLLLAPGDEKMEDIMETNLITAHTLEDRESAVKKFGKYDLIALPVVDNENRMVGILTIDDAVDVIQEENTEDFEKMAAMAPTEDTYFRTGVFRHTRNRIVWLVVLMLSSTITGLLTMYYEHAFLAFPLLVAFIPMLTDTGGNCGSQSSTLIIRGMAVDEIHIRDFFTVIWKEIRVSCLVGAILALINFVRIYFQYGHDWRMAAVVALTLIAVVVMSKLLGCMLPMLAARVKIDPAMMAAPLITTIVDAGALVVYFNVAIKLLGI
jgi:magnesium transporter